MSKDSLTLSILIIEDNLGDFVLLEDHLLEKFDAIQIFHEESFESAILTIKSDKKIDIILLDLVLPDLQGEVLAKKIQQNTTDIPIIILTGYTDIDLARKILSLGVSDFLIKDEINPEILYKSIIYSLERKSYINGLNKTKKTYQDLFNLSPQPMWLYDTSTLFFLDVNQAAIDKYGYTLEEFRSMTIKDIRPKNQIKYLQDSLAKHALTGSVGFAGFFTHTLKSGKNISVEIFSSNIDYNGRLVRLVLANDVTDKLEHTKKIEAQNVKLKDIAWTQSHVVRAPLSRILGIINLIELESFNSKDLPYLIEQLKLSGNEMDVIVRNIVNEAKLLNINESNNE
ncbi:response regulator [Confluentibacter flavum]|uniref:Histidine kinase n=1 Tax=Confluentibacter flavum TaxID=1909700 RepID=A0A2N3HLP6_9FLAO|nr:response regulator [Confluentibacter flavum]PKQ45822.1 histidine kinase [Confluentibacter flavum]